MVLGDIAVLRLGEGHTRPVRRCLNGKKARIVSVDGETLKVSLLHDGLRTFSIRPSDIESMETSVSESVREICEHSNR